MAEDLLLMTAVDIVVAYLQRNAISPAQVPELVVRTYNSMAALGQPEAEPKPEPEAAALPKPAVSIRASLKHDRITCIECGQKLKSLKRHLTVSHAMTPTNYRTRWNLPADYPMVTPEYAARRRGLAIENGLGHHPQHKRGRKKKAMVAAGEG